jgi:hypothetical protein
MTLRQSKKMIQKILTLSEWLLREIYSDSYSSMKTIRIKTNDAGKKQ